MEIRYDGPVPPHRQIADWLRGRIISGELGPDARLPTEADVQQELGAARTTTRRAMRLLRDQGWVYTVPSRGTFVRADHPSE